RDAASSADVAGERRGSRPIAHVGVHNLLIHGRRDDFPGGAVAHQGGQDRARSSIGQSIPQLLPLRGKRHPAARHVPLGAEPSQRRFKRAWDVPFFALIPSAGSLPSRSSKNNRLRCKSIKLLNSCSHLTHAFLYAMASVSRCLKTFG